MAVTGGVPALASGMVKTQIAYSELKKAGILSIGVACSKLSGGTYVMWNNHDILCVESPGSHDILFSGKRVTANILKSTDQIPNDFGTGPGVMKSGLADITLESRKELKETISKLANIILKKEEKNKITAEEAYENSEDFEKTASTAS